VSIGLRGLEPSLRANAGVDLAIAKAYGLAAVITPQTRTLTEQAKLRANFDRCVAEGKFPSGASLTPGMNCKYPANQPGASAHNCGRAWDSWVPDDEMPLWVRIREYCGFHVRLNDPVHAELPDWRDYVG